MPLAATWMQLEVIILGEESQKEKDKYHMISQMWSLKYDTTICETETDSQTSRIDLQLPKGRGRGRKDILGAWG